MTRDSFVVYRSFIEAMRDLPREESFLLFEAISSYALDGIEIELTGAARGMFRLIKPQIDANNKRYENGTKGGRPKEISDNQNITKEEPSDNQDITNTKPNVNDNDNANANAKANEKENVNGNDNGNAARSNHPLTDKATVFALTNLLKYDNTLKEDLYKIDKPTDRLLLLEILRRLFKDFGNTGLVKDAIEAKARASPDITLNELFNLKYKGNGLTAELRDWLSKHEKDKKPVVVI